ncbi:GNAT family N-acetyltransferase [Lewinella sp. IMCC34183]|uniref:GNAT family N-acetyltransferase n=1 Tax=Lewinella sp. IMCC34183 TaxID=2248762 RepID=UPI000E2374C1|nr:GNAT family N-acetyltransferase [Lewinella sp. IMCC34183]
MTIAYHHDRTPSAGEIIDLFRSAGLNRPVDDPDRIRAMYAGSDLVVSAWEAGRLVGISRSLTDWHWNCYLADLAVHPDYQHRGIGRALIERTAERLGGRVMIHLIAAPSAVDYYEKVGFLPRPACFFRERTA